MTTQVTLTLPEIITQIRRVRGGYSVYNGQNWLYFPDSDLTPEQVEELEDWREELKPRRVA